MDAGDLRSQFALYKELSKPRIAWMVLVTISLGYGIGCKGNWNWWVWLNTIVGAGLLTAASSAWNQWLEQHSDQKMTRTQVRPLPSGRISTGEVAVFGMVTSVLGTVQLILLVDPITAWITFSTFLLYVFVYTPMKRWTSLATAVGAIPGALPPVIGWTAAGQPLGWEALSLFLILFLWQFPHFWAIAWLYQQQYAEAGLRMVPFGQPKRGVIGGLSVLFAVLLLACSWMPVWLGMSGIVYGVIAILFGLAYLWYSLKFSWNESRPTARAVLFCSLFYLPTVLLALVLNHYWRVM